jgi:hypothetical protein
MHRTTAVVLALCALGLLNGNVYAQLEISWGGGDGSWSDENWTDGAGLDYIENFTGTIDGSNGSGGPNGEDIITIGSGVVEYPADDLQSDFRMKQGSQLIITGGATWVQAQDDSWSENRWTEMDLSKLTLDNGTFSRTGAVSLEGGGALIFGSWRGDDNQDTWLPYQETSIEIINGGRLENEGSLWLGSPDDVLPDSIFTMTINGGTVDLTGGDFPPAADETAGWEGDLFFFQSINEPTFSVNFTGPGSITVDETGIVVYDVDLADGEQVTYEELWDLGILQANGLSGQDGEAFANYFAVTGNSGQDDYTLSWKEGLVPQLQPGDANQDLTFDQFDIIKALQAAKYLTGQSATWGEGDWDGAPGGSVGDPPAGNGFFDQLDIIKALASGVYNTGPYGASSPGGGQTLMSVPEPSAIVLLGLGVVGGLLSRRRRRW